jgi:hypothetical protein
MSGDDASRMDDPVATERRGGAVRARYDVAPESGLGITARFRPAPVHSRIVEFPRQCERLDPSGSRILYFVISRTRSVSGGAGLGPPAAQGPVPVAQR